MSVMFLFFPVSQLTTPTKTSSENGTKEAICNIEIIQVQVTLTHLLAELL